MFCNKCGKELENNIRFCNACGIEIKREITENGGIKSSKAAPVKKRGVLTKIAMVAMAVIIVVMGSYIVVDVVRNNDGKVSTDFGTVEDKNVDLAVSALMLEWKDLYREGKAGDGHLEIIHTRVVRIDPAANEEFFSKLDKGNLIEYVVEFTLYSDYFGSAPYYHNANTCDTVIIYSDGTTNVTDNILRRYSNYTYSYDYSKLVKNVKDYGTAFNETIDLKNEIDTDFTVLFPEDLDTYDLKVAEISSGFAIKNNLDETILDASHVDKISICEINDGYSIKLTLTEKGKNIFSQYTTDHVNAVTYVCIYDSTIMAPVIPEPITDGVLTIPMSTYEEAESLFENLS